MVSLGLEYLEVEPWSFHSIVHDTSFRQNGRPGVQTTGKHGVSTQSSKASAHGGRSGLSKSFTMASGLEFPRAFLTLLGLLKIRSLLVITVSTGRYLLSTGGLLH